MSCNEEKENSVTDTAAAAAAEKERRERDILARQRLTDERVELQTRIAKLAAFVTEKSDTELPTQFQRLDEVTQGLLIAQHSVMCGYDNILELRAYLWDRRIAEEQATRMDEMKSSVEVE